MYTSDILPVRTGTKSAKSKRGGNARHGSYVSNTATSYWGAYRTDVAHPNDETNTHANIGETDRARREVVRVLEDKSHRGEEEVHDAVVDGDVDGHEEYNGREDQDLQGAHNAASEDLAWR
jgi:hypothetical protein